MGKPAERAFRSYSDARDGQHVEWLIAPHPSPRVKAGYSERWPEVTAAFARAATVCAD